MPTVPGPVSRVRMTIADVSESASCCCREGQTRMCKTSNSPQKTAGCGRRNRLLVCRNSWTALHDAANKNDFELCKILCRSDRAAKLHLYSTTSGERLRFASAFAVRERNAARVVLHRALTSRRELRHYEFAEKSAAPFRFVPSACPAFGVSRKPAVGSVRVCVLADALLTLSLALGGERR